MNNRNVKSVAAGMGANITKAEIERRHYPSHHGAGKDEWMAMSWHHEDYLNDLKNREDATEAYAKQYQK